MNPKLQCGRQQERRRQESRLVQDMNKDLLQAADRGIDRRERV